jgi:hypothetical protein
MVAVHDEEWLVGATQQTLSDGLLVHCIGTSTLVRDTEATFSTILDRVVPLRPVEAHLVQDDSPSFRMGSLYLEWILRKTPLPPTKTDLVVVQHQLLNPLEYQRRAVHSRSPVSARASSSPMPSAWVRPSRSA